MNKYYVRQTCETPMVVALGFFDCIHNGHVSIIEETKKQAEKLGAQAAVTTFANDPNSILKKKPQVYTLAEREIVLQNLGINNIIYSYFNEEFANCTAERALDVLTENFNVVGVVAGKDFTYGKDAEGNAATLKEYMEKKGIKVKIMPFEKLMQKKVSTTIIKRIIPDGNVAMINSCLPQPYFMVGTIIRGRERGRVLGFPTANLSVHPDNMRLGSGIYATRINVNGKMHNAVTNVGNKPTFGENDFTIETYILDFNEDIYGKEVILEFHTKIRDMIKFPSIPALRNQLLSDVKSARRFFEEN